MHPKPGRRDRFVRWALALLVPLVPVLAGYVFYVQRHTPVLDFRLDGRTGRVLSVPQESFADWAGLQPGDLILSVDGVPFSEWLEPAPGNYAVEIERAGHCLTLELPLIPLVKVNAGSLIGGVLVALVFWGAGVLLLWRRSWRSDVRILFLLSQVFAVAALFLLAHPTGVRPLWMSQACVACFHLAGPLLVHHSLTFPHPLGSPARRRWGMGLVYGLALVVLTGLLWGRLLWTRLGVLYPTVEVAVAIGVMVYVYVRRATPDGRRRLRLLLFGNAVAGVPSVLFYLLPSVVGLPSRMPGWVMGLFLVAAPLSYLYAMTRHNLFGVDRLLNRALVYALLSLGILLLYLGLFVGIYRFLPGDPLLEMMAATGLTLLVGFSFNELRVRVQRLVDRLFYGGWYDYASVVEAVSDALARTLDRDRLTEVLTRRVPAMMRLHPGRLEIGEPGELPSDDLPPSPTTARFRLSFRGQARAVWTAGPRRDGDDLTETDRRILQTLARQAEVALGNVLLIEALRHRLDEIRAVQNRLLRSREEERARLARELHDSPVQLLVGLNLQLGLLLAGMPSDEPDTSGLVRELTAVRAQVRRLLADLRQVCAELRPPMLDTLGLGAAFRALLDEWSAQSGVEAHADLLPDEALRALPDEVAVNLYRVVQEALSNVARHADARRVTLRLTEEGDRLVLTVRDDGRGFVPAAPRDLVARGHFGLAGMQERVALIGGTLAVESAPGRGTTVRVVWGGESAMERVSESAMERVSDKEGLNDV